MAKQDFNTDNNLVLETNMKIKNPLGEIIFQSLSHIVYLSIGLIVAFALIRMILTISSGSPTSAWNGYNAQTELLDPNISFITQFFIYLQNFLSGNWGRSWAIAPNTEITKLIFMKIGIFFELLFIGFLVSLIVSLPMGFLSAKKENQRTDKFFVAYSNFLYAIPIISVILLFKYVFTIKTTIFPTVGLISGSLDYSFLPFFESLFQGQFSSAFDILQHYILPSICLSIPLTYMLFPVIRENQIHRNQNIKKKYCDNSSKSLFNIGFLLVNFIIIENMFNLNSIGMLIIHSLLARDFLITLGLVFLLVIFISLFNFILTLINIIRFREFTIENIESNEPNLFKNYAIEPLNSSLSRSSSTKSIYKIISLVLGIIVILGLVIWSYLFVFTHNYSDFNTINMTTHEYTPPSSDYLFGTTQFGQDVYGITLFGISYFLLYIFATGMIGCAIGLPFGILTGLNRITKKIATFITNLFFGIPFIIVLILYSISQSESDTLKFYILMVITIANIFLSWQFSNYLIGKLTLNREVNQTKGQLIKQAVPDIFASFIKVLIWTSVILFTIQFTGFGIGNEASLGKQIALDKSKMITAPWTTFYPAFFLFLICFGLGLIYIALKNHSENNSI